jgi:alpha/beta superfamily hydrolase
MFISGPAGQLEAELTLAKVEKTITAVLCHPHPLYGGSMHDMVLDTLAEVLLARGINCLRFNFRGAGASEGTHDQGNGEVEDLHSVITWLQNEYPRDDLWLAGYSFGANIVWKSLPEQAAELALLVAPPVGAMPFLEAEVETPVHAFAGDADDYVDLAKLDALPGVTSHVIPGADHFFMGHHATLAEEIRSVLSTVV